MGADVDVVPINRQLTDEITNNTVRMARNHPGELFNGWIGTENLGGFVVLVVRDEQRMFGGPAPPLGQHVVVQEGERAATDRLQNSIDLGVCAHCGAANPPHRCSRCRQAKYCNRECQLADYQEHRPMCRAIANAMRI